MLASLFRSTRFAGKAAEILRIAGQSLSAYARYRIRGRRQRHQRPLVLLVMEKWAGCDPAQGLTNSLHNLAGSMAASGVADHRIFFYDKYARRTGLRSDVGFLRAVARLHPDCVVATIVPGLRLHPSLAAFKACRRVFGAPLVFLWFDFVDTTVVRGLALEHADIAAASVVLDVPQTVTADPGLRQRFLPRWTPQDERVFRDRQLVRDIDVCFLGARERYPDRLAALDKLRGLGIRLHVGGGRREGFLPVEEYARVLARSRIVVNFSRKIDGSKLHQNKGRVFEALHCGALLLEQDNAQTRLWLEDGVDYVSFKDPDDLVAKIAALLADEPRRSAIAANGHAKALTCFSARQFWEGVLDASGVRKNADDQRREG